MIKVTISCSLPDETPVDEIAALIRRDYLGEVQITEFIVKGKKVELKIKPLDTVLRKEEPF